MQFLILILFVTCLGQTLFGDSLAPDNTFSIQVSMVGLRANRYYKLSFSQTLREAHFLANSVPATDVYPRGNQDTKHFYHHRGAFWIPFGITVSSLISPATLGFPRTDTGLSFLPGMGISLCVEVARLNEKTLKYHDICYRNPERIEPTDRLFQDSLYIADYRKGAQQRKMGKAFAGFGTGLGVAFLVVILVIVVIVAVIMAGT